MFVAIAPANPPRIPPPTKPPTKPPAISPKIFSSACSELFSGASTLSLAPDVLTMLNRTKCLCPRPVTSKGNAACVEAKGSESNACRGPFPKPFCTPFETSL